MTTSRFAVFGNPIHHSYSPKMHHLFAQQCGLKDFLYEKVLVQEEDFEKTVHEFFAQGGKGLNITVPFKLKAFELARHHLTPRAQAAGAVNTLWVENGDIYGDNTDGIGLVKDIQRLGVSLQQSILLIGAGGASRGVILPLIEAGCTHLHIVNRTASKAIALLGNFKHLPNIELSASGFETLNGQWDIIINASASSLANNSLPIENRIFQQAQLAYDMLYTADAKTTFLQQAQSAGVKQCADGLGMLVYQGAESFEIWNHLHPQAEKVLSLLRQDLQQCRP